MKNNYPPNCDGYPFQQGWQCPICSVVWAPSVQYCYCDANYPLDPEDQHDDED